MQANNKSSLPPKPTFNNEKLNNSKKKLKNIAILDEYKHTMLEVMVPFHTKPQPYDPFLSYQAKHSSRNKDAKTISLSPSKTGTVSKLQIQDDGGKLPSLPSSLAIPAERATSPG